VKLYLSSYRLGNHPEKLANLFTDNKNVAVIANAMDFVEDITRKEKANNSITEIQDLGLFPEEIDLRDYFGKQKELGGKLTKYGGVWVRGGNTFILRRAMAQSGFDVWIKNKTNDPDFIYAGYSAGICILSPTLRGIEFVDDPNVVPQGYSSQIIWDGLGTIDHILVPHYKSNHPESKMVDTEVEHYINNKTPFKTLRDGDVIIQESSR
jgi:dipeptidase E